MTPNPLTGMDRPSHPGLTALLRLQGRLLNVSRLATVGELTSGVAHELNQPLCAVVNYAQACDRFLAQPNPDIACVREALANITSQALRASDAIRRLRKLASPTNPRQRLTDVNSLLRRLSDLIRSDANHRHVQYRLETASNLLPVCVNRAQIQQLVLNLVHNAIEALADLPTDPREVTVHAIRNELGDVDICVSDCGPGVPEAIAPYLFMPFHSSKAAGTGLGLAISRTLAQANSGTLRYRPNLPRGACFTLTLPAAPRALVRSLRRVPRAMRDPT